MGLPLGIQVKCPKCSESMMSADHRISGKPSIQLEAKVLDKVGAIYLSQLYGDFNKEFVGVEDVQGAVVELSCPHCHQPLPVRHLCICEAPVVRLDLHIGGVIKFCSKNGCKHHSLEFENADDAFSLFKAQDETGLA